MMLLIFLQNTYEYLTDTPEWETALWESHTGKRLREMLPDDIDFVVTNASRTIGENADSVCAPDPEHIRATIARVQPTTILACGRIAQRALSAMDVDFVVVPHPSWRLLSGRMTSDIRDDLQARNGEKR